MKLVIALVGLLGLALAAPQSGSQEDTILRQTQEINVDSYNYNYETSNGIAGTEEGVLKNFGTENEAIDTQGQYSYMGPDGVTYQATYIANENSFQPSV